MIDLTELEIFAVGAVCPTIDAKLTQAMRNALPALIAIARAARRYQSHALHDSDCMLIKTALTDTVCSCGLDVLRQALAALEKSK